MHILAINLDTYNSKNFYYLDPKNNLIMDGKFSKIIYTEPYYTINDIYYYIPIEYTHIDYHKEQYTVNFDTQQYQNRAVLHKIYKLEMEILYNYANYVNCRKISSMSIYNKLLSGQIRMSLSNPPTHHTASSASTSASPSASATAYKEGKIQFLLKISGVWENNSHFGITAKIVESNIVLP
jgi:hypothetical protein